MLKISIAMAAVLIGASLLSGCAATAVGMGAMGAVAEAVSGNSPGKELRRRAQESADIQAYEDAQTPQHVESETAYLAMIGQMQKQGVWFASLAHIDALETRWKASPSSQILRADALRQVGERDASTAIYRSLLNTSHAARAWHGLGLNAAAQGRFSDAVAHMQTAQKLAPTDALLLNDLGFALMHTHPSVSAGLPLKQAAQLDANNPRIQSNLAVYLVLHGEATDATRWMNEHQMNQAQRLRVFEVAQRIAVQQNQPLPAPVQETVMSPVATHPSACVGCLIFEHKLALPTS